MTTSHLPTHVKLVEVSPRDGLQNESVTLPTDIKIAFINHLSKTGLSVIEATSFVSPKWIPQLSDHKEVFQHINKSPSISYPVFVPNIKGLQNALEIGVKEIAVFSTPSKTFCERNINCSPTENLLHIAEMTKLAKENNIRIRAYISCVLGCPYEGEISPQSVAALAKQLIELGCYEISLGDTIGVGTPLKTQAMLEKVLKKVNKEKIAVHFHNTYGQALANIYAALCSGIASIDSSVAGLGGCPYAKGASGNIATEDVLYMLNGMNIHTGVDLTKLVEAGRFIVNHLKVPMQSNVNLAMN